MLVQKINEKLAHSLTSKEMCPEWILNDLFFYLNGDPLIRAGQKQKSVFQIRIRIGSGPESRKSEITRKKKKKVYKFHVLLFGGAGGFSYKLKALHGV
jgi:hypothetical protein